MQSVAQVPRIATISTRSPRPAPGTPGSRVAALPGLAPKTETKPRPQARQQRPNRRPRRKPTPKEVTPKPDTSFDLVDSIEGGRYDYLFDKDKMEAFIESKEAPRYIEYNVERLMVGRHNQLSYAYCVLAEVGLDRLNNWPEKKRWEEFKASCIGTGQTYAGDTGSSDFRSVFDFCKRFDFRPFGDQRGKFKTRITPTQKSKIASTAQMLGLYEGVLFLILVTDALRALPGVIGAEDMTRTVEEFYSQLRLRSRQLACHMIAHEIDLSDDVREQMGEMGICSCYC